MSLCTATVLMPKALAVRMMRQAISPRLAISSVVIIIFRSSIFLQLAACSLQLAACSLQLLALPVRFALFEEGFQAFLAFLADADTGDGAFRVPAQGRAQGAMTYLIEQLLARGHRLRAVQQPLLDPLFDGRVEGVLGIAFGEQTQHARPFTVEGFGTQGVAACGA